MKKLSSISALLTNSQSNISKYPIPPKIKFFRISQAVPSQLKTISLVFLMLSWPSGPHSLS
jgi:hypothetical protein